MHLDRWVRRTRNRHEMPVTIVQRPDDEVTITLGRRTYEVAEWSTHDACQLFNRAFIESCIMAERHDLLRNFTPLGEAA